MDDETQAIVDALRRAYPDGVPDEDYRPLLRLLIEDMSEEGLGIAVEGAFAMDRDVAQNDSAKVLSIEPPSPEDVARVEARLRGAGWEPMY